MKGIRKVFLGLVFMTLFCVGFNVSAKADPTVKVSIVKDGSTLEKWKDGASIEWKLNVDDGDFPDKPGEGEENPKRSEVYTINLVGAGDPKGNKNKEYKIILYKDINEKKLISYDNGERKEEVTEGYFPKSLVTLDQGAVKDMVDTAEEDHDVKTFEFTANQLDGSPVSVSEYKVTATVEGGPSGTEISPDTKYLLPGQSQSFSVSKIGGVIPGEANVGGTDIVYKSNDWSCTTGKDNVNLSDKEVDSATVTMLEDNPGAANVSVSYGTVSLKFSKALPSEMTRDSATPDSTIEMTATGCDKYAKPVIVKINDVELSADNDEWRWTSSQFRFKVPKNFDPDNTDEDIDATLKIVMEDGNTFLHDFVIKGSEPTPTPTPGKVTVTITTDPSGAGTVTATVVDAETGDKKDSDSGTSVTVTGAEGDLVTIEAKQDKGNEFDYWKLNSGDVEIDDEENPQDFNLGSENVKITAYYENSEPVEINPIRLTSTRIARLSAFTEDGPDVMVNYDLLKCGSYFTKGKLKAASEDSTTNDPYYKARYIAFTADDTDTYSSKDSTLTYNGEEYDVTIYGWPEITGSGSSSSLVVQMPEGVFHEDGKVFDVEDLKKARIYFINTSDDDDKEYKDVDLSDHKKSFDKVDLGKDLADDDEYDFDCDTIMMKAYPSKGGNDYDEYVYAERKFYKIKLDESGGAKYKINDDEVSGYFYAADGMEYKISCSAKNGGSFQKWDNSEFSGESGGTFKASGTKTFKAIYTGSSSYYYGGSSYYYGSSTGRTTATGGTGSGGSGGDYDDVPKTGESKTDIWILWSVLLVSILGAGFMIYKRFGLVRAIAEADREEAEVVQQEMAQKEQKDKENMINTLKGLRKL